MNKFKMTEKEIIKAVYSKYWIIDTRKAAGRRIVEKARERGFWIDWLLGADTARITKSRGI